MQAVLLGQFFAMIGGLGVPELLIILVIVLLVFGAGKLPQIGDSVGKAIRNFKKASNQDDNVEDVDVKPRLTAPRSADAEADIARETSDKARR
jgi:sec-independent protein translocase protein TatA